MTTKVDEIAPRIYRLSTLVPEIGPTGFTFNQFLLDDDEPLLFHTGHRSMFPTVREAIERVLPLDRLRWIAFGHVESDECGAMNEFLAAAPHAEVVHGAVGCMISLNEMADRPPRAMADGETLQLGAMRIRHIDTPHVPHAWEARVLYEETTGTLLCGDLFTHLGDGPALTEADIVGPAVEAEDLFGYSSLAPGTPATIERLAGLQPRTLGLMHGSSFTGDGEAALRALADAYAGRLQAGS
jgi:flavorubredoxin